MEKARRLSGKWNRAVFLKEAGKVEVLEQEKRQTVRLPKRVRLPILFKGAQHNGGHAAFKTLL